MLVLASFAILLEYVDTTDSFGYRDPGKIAVTTSVFMFFFLLNGYLDRKRIAREVVTYAGKWGNEQEILRMVEDLLVAYGPGSCIVAEGWVICPGSIPDLGFFPLNQISRLALIGDKDHRALEVHLVDDRRYKLAYNMRDSLEIYISISEALPKVKISQLDKKELFSPHRDHASGDPYFDRVYGEKANAEPK